MQRRDAIGESGGTGRVEAFSDGVFAIAITLLVLEIRVPEDTSHLLQSLLELGWSYVAYVVSFLLIGLIWTNHHVMFERITHADRGLLFLNTLLLMDVAFLPFVTAVLAAAFRSGEGEPVAAAAYGATLTIGGVFFNAIWAYARRRSLLTSGTSDEEARRIGRRFLLGPALYAVATAVAAVLPLLATVLFAGLILLYWLPVPGHRAR